MATELKMKALVEVFYPLKNLVHYILTIHAKKEEKTTYYEVLSSLFGKTIDEKTNVVFTLSNIVTTEPFSIDCDPWSRSIAIKNEDTIYYICPGPYLSSREIMQRVPASALGLFDLVIRNCECKIEINGISKTLKYCSDAKLKGEINAIINQVKTPAPQNTINSTASTTTVVSTPVTTSVETAPAS